MLEGSTFQVGDIVEMTAEASATGMLDFVEGNGYRVEAVDYNGKEWCAHNVILLKNESGKKYWYNVSHFKLKEEKKVETDFRAGQTVWCVLFGKGVVESIDKSNTYPVEVQFDCGEHRCYTLSGDMFRHVKNNRALFFSEPKAIAETKPAFVPTFKKGDVLFTYGKHKDVTGDMGRIVVSSETEQAVFDENDIGWLKTHWEFYKLGEKIEFN